MTVRKKTTGRVKPTRCAVARIGVRIRELSLMTGPIEARLINERLRRDDYLGLRLETAVAEVRALEQLASTIPARSVLGALVQMSILQQVIESLLEPASHPVHRSTVDRLYRLIVSSRHALWHGLDGALGRNLFEVGAGRRSGCWPFADKDDATPDKVREREIEQAEAKPTAA